MEFKFNFDIENDDDETASTDLKATDFVDISSGETSKCIRPIKEIQQGEHHKNYQDISIAGYNVGDMVLDYLEPSDVLETIECRDEEENAISKAISSHSDLLPHVYEGGLKVWECTLDLIHYLHEADIPFSNQSVLDIGCGAGLLGIYALRRGADHVLFQDYNEEVLQEMTISNVLLNIAGADDSKKSDVVARRCRFLSGDWSLMKAFLTNSSSESVMKYDTILTSETIYSIESQPVLHDLIKAMLKPTGIAYIAAKTHYFGVGGGTRMFEDLVRERGDFTISVCKEYKDGVQREILKMEFNQAASSDR